jgi:hypothetical protein
MSGPATTTLRSTEQQAQLSVPSRLAAWSQHRRRTVPVARVAVAPAVLALDESWSAELSADCRPHDRPARGGWRPGLPVPRRSGHDVERDVAGASAEAA